MSFISLAGNKNEAVQMFFKYPCCLKPFYVRRNRSIILLIMGHKKVCFHCKKAFSVYQNNQEAIYLSCPNCGNTTTLFNHKFRPPKQNDVKQWKLVEFLKDYGFVYQHIYKQAEGGGYLEVPYPNDLTEAKEFVEKYKSQAYTDNNIF